MPVVQILLFGFAVTNEISNVDIAVLDRSKDSETQKIINTIEASKYFKVTDFIVDEKQIETIFKKGKVKAVLVFENNFSKDIVAKNMANVQIITDATEPNVANSVNTYLTSILQQYQTDLNQRQQIPYQIVPQTRMYYNPELKSVFMFVPGIMTVILMLVSAIMTSISITREKELGTMEILLVSPLKPYQVIVGKVFPYVFLAISNAIIILMLGFFVFKMPIEGSYFLLALETVLFIFSALALGILISTISETQQTAMMASLMGLMLPTILLSGFIFPISSMPLPLQVISNIIPAKWFIILIKGILLKGVGLEVLWKETLVLVAMIVAFIGLSVMKYKTRLE
ncbi:transport permease protein [Ulvibacter litoralis]|nr:transport permease protein [Ulvibacter litoralis]